MSYLSNELIDTSKHYNQLNIKQKLEVCQFWDSNFEVISPANFEGSYRRIFENAKKAKSKYSDVYPYGLIDEIPEDLDFRSISNKQFAVHIVKPLYSYQNRDVAKRVNQVLGIKTEEQEQGEIFRLNDLIKELCLELDIKEKEIRDQMDTMRYFVREGKILNSEYYSKLNEERSIDKPDTKVYSNQFS